jgi:type I restriction enzyme S subunit
VSARELITEHLDLWTGAVTKKSSSGRGSNGKVELTGIKKLRELILELALSGRLVEPEPNEEPAQRLLAKIEAEKAHLIAQGLIKKPKKLTEASNSQPYSLPPHWCWVQLGSVTNYGTTDKAEPNQVADNTWVLELEDIEKESSKLLNKVRYTERQFKSSKNRFERSDVLYGKLRPYLDKVLVADEPGVCTTEIVPIRGYLGLLPEFLRLALKSPSFKRYANDSTHGMNLPRLGTDKARLAMIPLAPEQEQHRIVQKVDELMTLCDRLEQQTSDQLEAHETLVDTLLGTLTQSENATELADNWARLAAHFDTLFTTEQSIDKLKQTILQLAVMGRLVEQDAADEPVSELLDRIKKEKANLVRSGKLKSQKALASVSDEEKPYSLPENWIWARLGSYAADIHYGYTASASATLTEHRLLRITDIQNNKVNWTTVPGCEITEQQAMPYLLYNNDILIARTGGTIGKSYLVENIDVKAVFASYLIRVRKLESTNAKYLKIFLGSQTYWDQLYEAAMGTGQPNVNGKSLKNLALPIPPLQEQHRVVSKVDELMALCDHLKQRLNQASETRNQLADAVVEGALG